jgi:hypothetical protein
MSVFSPSNSRVPGLAWIAAALVAVSVPLAATPATAQPTTCDVSGEFVIAATYIRPDGVAAQVGGLFTFSPPADCASSAVGTVTIAAAIAAPGQPAGPFGGVYPYTVTGQTIAIENGWLVGGLSGVTGGMVTSIALNGGHGLAVTGTLIRRDIAASIGSEGTQGPAGATGPIGPAGPQGPAGPEGPIGATGAMGIQGLTGSAGPQGLAGPAGPQGPAGPEGPIGETGATGATGTPGPTGIQGLQGPVGPQGLQGFQGFQGADGAPGSVGPAGPIGPVGPTGPQGPAGGGVSAYLSRSANTAPTLDVVFAGTAVPMESPLVPDTGIVPDVSNSVFTVASAGVYRITYEIRLSTPVFIGSRVLVDGAFQQAGLGFGGVAAGDDDLHASSLVTLAAGATVQVQLYLFTGSVTLPKAVLTIEKIN